MGLFTKYKGLEAQGNVVLKSLKFNNDDSFNSQPFIQTPIPGDDGALSITNNKNTGVVNAINEAATGFLNLNDKLKPSKALSSISRGIYRSGVDVVRLSKFMTTPAGIEFIAKQELLSLNSPRTETSGVLNGGIYNPLATLLQAGVNAAGIHLISGQDNLAKINFRKSETNAAGERITTRPGRFGITSTYGSLAYWRGKVDPKISIDNRLIGFYSKHITSKNDRSFLYRYIGGPDSYLGLGYTTISFATDPAGNPIRTMGENFIFPEGESNTPETYQAVYEDPGRTTYETKNELGSIEARYGLGYPNRISFNTTTGKYQYPDLNINLDKVNGHLIYSSNAGAEILGNIEKEVNDLITFKIGIIELLEKGEKTNYMHFRSFIDSFSDSYSSDWSSQTYMGRGEKLYKYNSFDRSVNISFTVAAQSQNEMWGMYQKLNYLASSLTPQYTNRGYMTGNIAKLTVGKYLNNVHGKIDSLTYDIPEESPWMIDPYVDDKKGTFQRNDLPFIIKVQMKFTPIHDFRPELVKDVFDVVDKQPSYSLGDKYYIASPNNRETEQRKVPVQEIETVGVSAGKGIKIPTVVPKPLYTDYKGAKNDSIATTGIALNEYTFSDLKDDTITPIVKGAESATRSLQRGRRNINRAVKFGAGNAFKYIKEKLTKDSKPPIASG